MHTGQPQLLLDPETGVTWHWLLHWGSHLPRVQHMTASGERDDQILNFALLYFVEDLHRGTANWLDGVSPATAQQGQILRRHALLTKSTKRLPSAG